LQAIGDMERQNIWSCCVNMVLALTIASVLPRWISRLLDSEFKAML
jgi:hypothetical protein